MTPSLYLLDERHDYHYEYYGNSSGLALTATNEKALFAINTAIARSKGALVQGEMGVGKSQQVCKAIYFMEFYSLRINLVINKTNNCFVIQLYLILIHYFCNFLIKLINNKLTFITIIFLYFYLILSQIILPISYICFLTNILYCIHK